MPNSDRAVNTPNDIDAGSDASTAQAKAVELSWLAAFRQIATETQASFDPSSRCQSFLDIISPLLPTLAFADVVLLDGGRLQVVAHRGYPEGFFETWNHLTVGDGHLWEGVLRDNRPEVLENVDESMPSEVSRGYCRQAGIRASVVFPLPGRDHVLGALHFGATRPRQFPPDVLAALAAAAGQLGPLVENAILNRELRERASDLERLNRDLVAIDHLKSEFLAMVSHELRTPLTTILGYADLAGRPSAEGSPERRRMFLQSIQQSGRQLLTLINDLLEFSSLEAGVAPFDRLPIPLDRVLTRATARRSAEADRLGIQVVLEPMAGAPLVLADERQVGRIVDLLLQNAVKFSEPGGTVRVGCDVPPPGTWARIRVSDTGQGIPKDELDRIWNLFYQVDSSPTRRHGGLGLGLTIVRRLVELHGGKVWAESSGLPGDGATITFCIPVAGGVEAGTADLAADSDGRRTILIAEDRSDNAALVQIAIQESLGWPTVVAENGRQAIELANQIHPALILMDLMMPVMDGFEASARLKADPATRSIPVVALTAMARPQDAERARSSGCDDFIEKPFSLDELTTKLRRLLPDLAPTGVPSGQSSHTS